MKKIVLTAFDNKSLSVNVWDNATGAIGVVVISHGMAEHPDRYDAFANFLNNKGYIVLADDHRGHRKGAYNGINGVVDGDSWNQTISDIDTVVEYAKTHYQLPVALLGHSYGSFLAQCYTERYSQKLVGTVLSGTAYVKNTLAAVGGVLAKLQAKIFGAKKPGKLLNNLSVGSNNKPFLEQGQDFAWLSRDKAEVAKYEADPDCGYVLCIGYFMSFADGVMKMYGEDAKNISSDYKIMIAVGSDDPVNKNLTESDKLVEFYKGLGLNPLYKVYQGARHEVLNEINKDEVYNDMGNFIDSLFANY